ncbi:MAG: hypothetical protein NG747_15900 [Candidatus Brocadia sp.]|nr:hypothetical protein [Candidatus Brocadia sp.]
MKYSIEQRQRKTVRHYNIPGHAHFLKKFTICIRIRLDEDLWQLLKHGNGLAQAGTMEKEMLLWQLMKLLFKVDSEKGGTDKRVYPCLFEYAH